ncbi:MAG TPA: hypothetical protein VFQ22_06180 [Longimicrobiales bacterium]|nr:hypothetical protein [Longimicrobiales bacterium]
MKRARLAAAPALLLALATACGSGESALPPDLIDRETFVEVYVDLRRAALEAEGDTLTPALRDEILARHGVEARQLLDFAEVHGRDVELMRAIWDDVDERLFPPPDSLGP